MIYLDRTGYLSVEGGPRAWGISRNKIMEEARIMLGVSKEDFLQNVRDALGKKEPTRRAPEHVFLKASIRQQTQKADAILKRIEKKRPLLLE